MSDSSLVKVFRGLMEMRRDMRSDGSSESECSDAIERGLRAAMSAVPEGEWPHWARVPRCYQCDGYGWVIASTVNRLRIAVNEARPCSCHAGDKFRAQPSVQQDYTQAGKEKPKPKSWARL